jgi:hypothetical protein
VDSWSVVCGKVREVIVRLWTVGVLRLWVGRHEDRFGAAKTVTKLCVCVFVSMCVFVYECVCVCCV